MGKVREGDFLEPSASDWNRFVEVADHYDRTKARGEGGYRDLGGYPSGNLIKIRNDSPADRRRGEILKVGDYALAEISKPHPWFEGELHDGTDTPFAVCIDPIKPGKIGWAQINGVCPALVNFSHANHRYVMAGDAKEVLQSSYAGRAYVQYKPAGTGELECMVDLNRSINAGWGRISGTLVAMGSATCRVWKDVAGTMTDTGMDITVYDRLLDAGEPLTDKWRVRWELDFNVGRYYVIAAACSVDEAEDSWGGGSGEEGGGSPPPTMPPGTSGTNSNVGPMVLRRRRF